MAAPATSTSRSVPWIPRTRTRAKLSPPSLERRISLLPTVSAVSGAGAMIASGALPAPASSALHA